MSLNNRYDFVLLMDVKDGNPNGDPDAGNLPRLDAETGHGLITDVSLKRKIRNFVAIKHDQAERDPQPGEKRFEIYVREKAILNLQHQRAYSALKLDATESGVGSEPTQENIQEKKSGTDAPTAQPPVKKKRKGGGDTAEKAREWMCQNFYDIRTFGAVMSTGVNCGQVRGPAQLTFARSVDPIIAQEHSITRMAVATEAEAEKQEGDNRTMGRKHTVPYGLYVGHGFISAFLAKQTGFSDDDLELLWEAVENMFEHDRSAARGEMATRGLYVFKHDSELGNAHAYSLFERIQPKLKKGVAVPRSFTDYDVVVDDENLPDGVTLIRRVG
jgi:CRISPR-associated protein Csd2